MTRKDIEEFRKQLDEFSQKLDQKTREFNEKGEFSDVHRAYWERVESMHGLLHHRTAAASKTAGAWERVKDELAREHDAIIDEFARFLETLDADEMKSRESK